LHAVHDPGDSAAIDEAVRGACQSGGKSLNEVAVDALADGLGLGDGDVVRRDLSDVVGRAEGPGRGAALAAQDRVDEGLFK